MRFPVTWLLAAAVAIVPAVRVCAQETATQPAGVRGGTIQRAAARAAATQPAVTQPAAAQPDIAARDEHTRVHRPRRSPARGAQPRHADAAARGSTPPAGPAGVLSLGATDITGNKELPKVMVIVPWKGSLGASGVIKPTDSLMDEVLQPVDRSVFQRRIRYYGQLNAAAGGPPARQVAPVGDTH